MDGSVLPDTGPCSATCSQVCQLLKGCGLFAGATIQCVQQCATWPASQRACLDNLICSGLTNCAAAKACLPPPPVQADLTITDFTASVSGDSVTYTIKTCNVGQASATTFYVDIYYDRATAPGPNVFGDQSHSYSSLAPGACVTTALSRTKTPAGTYSSWAQVDADGIVAESDETNNVEGPLSLTVSGTPPPQGPDLTIKSFTHNIHKLNTVRYRVQVCNYGTGPAGATQVHIYFDQAVPPKQGQAGDQLTPVAMLQPGSCVFKNLYRLATPTGTYSSWAQVDPTNLVTETNENNNVAGPLAVTLAP
jgi:subtilase family serine protease